jgi:hypothetical protein
MFRTLSKESTELADLKLHLPDVDITTSRVRENSPMVGKSIGEIESRRNHGVTLLAVSRNQEVASNPGTNMIFQSGDLHVLIGNSADLVDFCARFLNPSLRETNDCDIPGPFWILNAPAPDAKETRLCFRENARKRCPVGFAVRVSRPDNLSS